MYPAEWVKPLNAYICGDTEIDLESPFPFVVPPAPKMETDLCLWLSNASRALL